MTPREFAAVKLDDGIGPYISGSRVSGKIFLNPRNSKALLTQSKSTLQKYVLGKLARSI
jgi:hypothetical protein